MSPVQTVTHVSGPYPDPTDYDAPIWVITMGRYAHTERHLPKAYPKSSRGAVAPRGRARASRTVRSRYAKSGPRCREGGVRNASAASGIRTRWTECGSGRVRSQRHRSGPAVAVALAGGGGPCLCSPRPVPGCSPAPGARVVADLRRDDGGGGQLGPRLRAEGCRSAPRLWRPGERLYPASVSRLRCRARAPLLV